MKTISFGGWYQRTTLHLTEAYGFFAHKRSYLDLKQKKLDELHSKLDIKSVKRKQGYLEHIEIVTRSGIRIKYYEDGLYVFYINSNEIEKDSKKLKKYFEEKWKPAINYIFSLGAPTPKILVNMKDNHSIVIGTLSQSPRRVKLDQKLLGKPYSETISRNAHVFKTDKYIATIVSKRLKKDFEPLVEMQIFFKEFKSQLHKYLNIHREIWEEIAEIKERKKIKGGEIGKEKSKLESYQTTINLIGNRINQMNSYAKTRASLAKTLKIEKELIYHFEYKHEDLLNTLEYIKEIWKMTTDYVNSALQVMRDLQGKTSTKGLKSIQLLASIGVVTGLVRYANTSSLQKVDLWGVSYILILAGIAFGLDFWMKKYAKNKDYKLKFQERAKNI